MEDLYERWDIEDKIVGINIFIKSLKEPSSREITDSYLKIIDNMNDLLEYYKNQLK